MPDAVVHGTIGTGAALPINATNDGRLEVDTDFSDMSVDAFNRLRVSNPLTLFDSSHRFSDNGYWSTSTANGGTAVFNANEGCVDLSVTTASGSSVIRETKKVFAYQPGKSLQKMNSFVLAPAQTNLRQRIGYFGAQNGIFVELDDSQISFVLRSSVTGSVVENRVSQANWNGEDRLDGSGPSGKILDVSKIQLFWDDLEWLSAGSVRVGFVINNVFHHCHTFNHANIISTGYMTTACLPLRYEITNKAATAQASTLKQICSTVISEGGYQLRGDQRSFGTEITAPYSLVAAGTKYPVLALRLKSARLDAIALPTAAYFMGIGNGHHYKWDVYVAPAVTGGSWISAGSDSSVEYNISGTAISSGTIVASGYFSSSNQSNAMASILKDTLFAYQLERNSFTSTPHVFAISVACDTANSSVHGTMDWEEVTR